MPTNSVSTHVLVVGIDGVRYDSMRAAATPALDGIEAVGVLLPALVHAKNPTVSGPVWSTVATGVYSDRHGVRDNDTVSAKLANFPDFTSMVRESQPGAETMIAASWNPIATDDGCGPIFSSTGWFPEPDPELAGNFEASWCAGDDAVLDYAARRLAAEDLAASFVYFGEADEIAHHLGTGIQYTDAIERCDNRLGALIDAIDSRPARATEEWTVAVVTDHGHVDAGGHGGDTEEERTAWIAASGPGIGKDIKVLCHADIAAHISSLFGRPSDHLDGVPFGARTP